MHAKDPVYNKDGTVNLIVEHPQYGEIPFTASPNDCEELGRELYKRAVAGEFGEIAPCVKIKEIPRAVTRFQARAALLQANLLDDVEAMMSSPETDPFITLAWKEVLEFRRDSPMILSIIPVLGLTEEQVDDLFRFASTISA